MKKILLFILSVVLLFCGCSKTQNDLLDSVLSDDTSSERRVAKQDTLVNKSNLDFSQCFTLSDSLLLFYKTYTSSSRIDLITVSYPNLRIVDEKTFYMNSNTRTEIRTYKSEIFIFNSRQAIKFDSGLKRIKNIDIPEAEYNSNIVAVNSDLTRLLYYDSEGLNIADMDFKNPKQLFTHLKWSKNPAEIIAYTYFVYFFDDDTKVFAYCNGEIDYKTFGKSNFVVYDLKEDKAYKKDMILDIEDSNCVFVGDNFYITDLVKLNSKDSEYIFMSYDSESNSFIEKSTGPIPNDKFIHAPPKPNADVIVNERYIIYTYYEYFDQPALYRFDMTTGKTEKKVFKSVDDTSNYTLLEFSFIPYFILPDGRIALYFYYADQTYIVDFS